MLRIFQEKGVCRLEINSIGFETHSKTEVFNSQIYNEFLNVIFGDAELHATRRSTRWPLRIPETSTMTNSFPKFREQQLRQA